MTRRLDFWNTDEWVRDSLCSVRARPDYWFPSGEDGPRRNSFAARAAIAICGDCPVSSECLDYALKHDLRYGIWGGWTSYERRLGRKVKTA